MNLFYSTKIKDEFIVLEGEEHKHCTKVLRKAKGSPIMITDGEGSIYTTQLIGSDRHDSSYKILERKSHTRHAPQSHIAIAPTKNINRFEWFIEKAAELGVHHIWPFISEHSERSKIREERIEKILISGMKQSFQSFKPILHPIQKFAEILNMKDVEHKYIAYLLGETLLAHQIDFNESSIITVGPEGGFSPQEYQEAIKHGFKGISLGASRLRSETAGIISTHLLTRSI